VIKAEGSFDRNAVGFILAGGSSTRMGSDKALVPLAGRPLIQHAIEILHSAGVSASIAGAKSDLGAFAPVVEDTLPGSGPLSGVCAALASTSARFAVILSVDAPLLPASLAAFLLRDAQITQAPVTLASVNGFAQTFPAVIARAALPPLLAELGAGRSGCYAAFHVAATELGSRVRVLPVELFAQSGHIADPRALPASFWFLNVNTPADLVRAEQLLARANAAVIA
jgi:molybdopterin-guanine dinucleotide biosynthesis protein A